MAHTITVSIRLDECPGTSFVEKLGDKAAISADLSTPSGWDEGGYAAFNVPGISIQPAVAGVPAAAGHSIENANISISDAGHKGLIQTAKISGSSALRLLLDGALRDKITRGSTKPGSSMRSRTGWRPRTCSGRASRRVDLTPSLATVKE